MALTIVTTSWKKNLLFTSNNPNGTHVLMDTSFANGGNEVGSAPKALMLSSLAGCSGLDVVMIAEKMKTTFSDLKIEIEANLTNEHPKYYDKVHVKYIFEGSALEKEKLKKVVTLSIEKYCGVMEMFRKFSSVTTEIIFNT